MALEQHLGGHANKTHLDHGALNYLKDTFNAKTYLDIGCGPGGMVELAEQIGLDSLGIDGDYTLDRYNKNRFLIHDFTKGPAPVRGTYDIGWSVEFVEHVYETYIPNYVQAFQSCKVLLLTYAPPGWEGHHHVNLQEEKYWIDTMSEYGLRYEAELTKEVRQKSTLNVKVKKGKKAFVRNRGLLFINENKI